ncbi:B-box zinc finger protein 22-like [Phragmites australis]|uniref:B-box zinc finger protein 22-like n=1 Tax=Phragmites australis TaxID=29695 RepID=UPI002D7878E0|nr:B-box zinc finger protein 22-like [Phragmites australis]
MKIQCNACGAAEARVLCCADEAALCVACDEEVHAANKLAGKHQRVPLLSDAGAPATAAAAPAVPKCDICQEASGYFFCLEDRALLCRDCDVAIHTVNSFVSVHQRFLLTGVQVGLDPADPVPPIADKHVNAGGGSVYQPKQMPKRNSTVLFSGEGSASVPSQTVINGDYSRQNSVPTVRPGVVDWTMHNGAIRSPEPPPKYFTEYLSEESPTLLQSSQTTTAFSNQINGDNDRAYSLPFSGGNGSDSLPDWPVDEFFSNSEYCSNFGFAEHSSSKGDNAKLGSAGGSPQCCLAEGFVAEELLGQVPGLDADEYLGRVPEISLTVAKVPSPPTASGLYWQGNLHYPAYDSTMFVPEIPSFQSSQNNFAVPAGFKRRRRQF